MRRYLAAVSSFYLQGFRSMRLGRTLWTIILVKLFILFAVLKPFFFPDYLQTSFATDAERADHVLARLAAPGAPDILVPGKHPARSGAVPSPGAAEPISCTEEVGQWNTSLP